MSFFSHYIPVTAQKLPLLNRFTLLATPSSSKHDENRKLSLIQYVNNLYSLNEALFSVTQACLFT